MIARLAGSHLEQLGLGSLALLLLLGVPAAVSPVVAIAPIVVMVWRIVPPHPTAFEAALPVRGREVVMARVVATLALVALPMCASMVVPLLDPFLTLTVDQSLSMRLATWTVGIVAALLPYHVNSGSLGPPSPVRRVLAWSALAAVGAAVLSLLPPPAAALLLALIAVAGVAVLWHSVPDALQLAPCRSERSEGPAFANRQSGPSRSLPRAERRGSGRHTLAGTGWRLATLGTLVPWRAALFYPILITMTMTDSAMIFFCIALLAVYPTIRAQTRWLAALPLTDRTRLLAVVLPSVVALTVCVGIGARVHSPFHRDTLTRDGPSTPPGHFNFTPTTVSLEHWLRAPSGSAPFIVAPWGERVRADTVTVLGMTFFNPYTWPDPATGRFRALQFARATTAVYGRPLTRAQYDAMSVYPRRVDGGFRVWLVNAAGLLTFGLLIALLSELGSSHRLRPGSVATRVAPFLFALPMALTAGPILLRVRDVDAGLPLLRGALRTVANTLPANPVLALLVAAVPVAAMYVLLEWQFRQSESAMVAKLSP